MKYSFLLLLLICSCINRPIPKLTSQTKKTLDSVRKYLECENVVENYKTKQVSGKPNRKYLTIDFYDVKRKHVNFDSINKVVMDAYENNGFELKKYYRVSLYYFDNYDNADLKKAFFYDSTRTLVEVTDR